MVVAAVSLAGCQQSAGSGGTPIPSSAPQVETPQQTFAPGEGRPVATDGTSTERPTSTPETPQPTISEALEVRIAEEDHSALDWSVSCSGLDSSPTVIASASDDAGSEYVVVLVGSGSGSLASFTFTTTMEGQSARDRSGLTVNPGAQQGNGSLIVDGSRVSSTGRGISYDEATVESEADSTYAVQFVCAG